MKILLTGGSGFIGRNILENIGKKYNVIAPSHHDLELLDAEAVRDFIRKNKIDFIIHGANRGGNRDNRDMSDVVEYNTRIFFNVARNSRSVKKIINLGSGAEYGKQRELVKVKEDDFDARVPEDAYGFAKYVCSKHAEASENIINLRLFGVYGKYENYRYRFVSNAIVKNLLALPIIIHKNVYFDYLFVDDLVRIIDFFLSAEPKYRVYNCTKGTTIDLVSLAAVINEIGEKPSEISVLNEGLNPEYGGDNTRLRQEIDGFKFTAHKDAIASLYDYYRNILSEINPGEITEDRYLQYCR